MSTLFVNNLNTASGSTITVPTGKKLVVTDGGGITAPGMVVQTVQSTASADFSTTSTSYVQGPQTSTFTMKNSSNKVLVTMNFLGRSTKTSGNYTGARFAIYRGDISSGTKITSGTEPQLLNYSTEIWAWQTLQFLDTPSASSVTYSIGLNRHSEAATAQIMGSYGNTVMLLQEIAT